MRRILTGLAVAIILTLGVVTPAFAIEIPSASGGYLLIENSYVFRNLLETDDMGFFISYDWRYIGVYPVDYPDEVSAESIIIRIMDGAAEVANIQPYPYWFNGYGKGSVFIYLTAAEVVAAGIAWADPLTIKLVGNPILSWTDTGAPVGSPSTSDSITAWTTETTVQGNRTALGNRILTQGIYLGIFWGSPLVQPDSGGTYYLTPPSTSANGEDYFMQVVNDLHTICPQIFIAKSTVPQYKEEDIPAYDYMTTLENELIGTDLDVSGGDPLGETVFGVDRMVLSSLMFAIGIIAGIIAIVSRGIAAPVAMLVSFVIIIFGARIGAISFYWIVLSVLGSGFIIARSLFPINQ
jgi:hypothetical protein